MASVSLDHDLSVWWVAWRTALKSKGWKSQCMVVSFEGNFLGDKLSGYSLDLGVHPIQLVPTFTLNHRSPREGCLKGNGFCPLCDRPAHPEDTDHPQKTSSNSRGLRSQKDGAYGSYVWEEFFCNRSSLLQEARPLQMIDIICSCRTTSRLHRDAGISFQMKMPILTGLVSRSLSGDCQSILLLSQRGGSLSPLRRRPIRVFPGSSK